MSNVNTVVIGGSLGNDAEVRHTPNGAAVTNFRIANSRKYLIYGSVVRCFVEYVFVGCYHFSAGLGVMPIS